MSPVLRCNDWKKLVFNTLILEGSTMPLNKTEDLHLPVLDIQELPIIPGTSEITNIRFWCSDRFDYEDCIGHCFDKQYFLGSDGYVTLANQLCDQIEKATGSGMSWVRTVRPHYDEKSKMFIVPEPKCIGEYKGGKIYV